MTSKVELKAKPTEISFKLKGVELKPTLDGKDTYKVVVYAPFRGRDGVERVSDYPTEMFIHGSELVSAKEMYDWLAKQSTGSTLKLRVAPGKVKQGKEDDGEWASYFWNLVGVPAATPAQQSLSAQAGVESPMFSPEDEPPPAGTERAKPKDYWDAKDALIGMSWAIDQARQIIMAYHGGPEATWDAGFWDIIKKEIADLAPRFLAMRDYLLGKKE